MKGHRIDGDSIVLTLRSGGQVTCAKDLIEKIEADEVPYPEPEAAQPPAPPARNRPAGRIARLLDGTPYAEIIASLSEAHGVNPMLVSALIQVESNFRPRARSSRGAMGLMQLMPSTAREYNVRNPFEPKANIEGGIRHLKSLIDQFGVVEMALAAYNAGEGAVRKFKGIPPYRETRDYVARILSLAGSSVVSPAVFSPSDRPPYPCLTSGGRPPRCPQACCIISVRSADNVHRHKILHRGAAPPGAESMEFRCRLGTPGGEIIEGVYVAESEARLRRDFEDKGLYVLGDPAGRPGRRSGRSGCRSDRASPAREFLVFNQELATLLKAGMPLVQSLDILRQRVTNPLLKTVLDDVYDRVRAGSSLSEAFEAHGTLFPGHLHGVAARGREERQPRSGDPALRRVREGGLGGEAEDDFGAGLSGDPARCCRASSSPSSSCGWFRSSARSTTSSARSCRCRRG